MKHKGLKVFFTSLLLSILFVFLFYLLVKDTAYSKLQEFPLAKVLQNPKSIFLLLLAFVLMPLNLYLDFSKWKIQETILNAAHNFKMFKGYMLGLAIAVITPNRSGEFLGRLFFMPIKKRFQTIIYSLRSSWTQFMVNVLIGFISLIFFTSAQINFPFSLLWLYSLILFVFLIALILFFTHELIIHKILSKNIFSSLFKYFQVSTRNFNKISNRLFWKLILFSVGRYIIYFLQFYILCKMFEVEIPVYYMLSGLATVFLLQTFLPVFSIFEIGVKGSLALFVFYNYQEEHFYLILSFGIMWLINVFLPAVAGLLLFLITQTKRIWKIRSYQKIS